MSDEGFQERPPARPTPLPADVNALMRRYGGLDYLMAETLLWFTDEELQVFLQKHGIPPYDTPKEEVSTEE